MAEIAGAFFRGEEVNGAADQVPEGVDGSSLGLAQQFFEFGEAATPLYRPRSGDRSRRSGL
jgi:hypothetical protein